MKPGDICLVSDLSQDPLRLNSTYVEIVSAEGEGYHVNPIGEDGNVLIPSKCLSLMTHWTRRDALEIMVSQGPARKRIA